MVVEVFLWTLMCILGVGTGVAIGSIICCLIVAFSEGELFWDVVFAILLIGCLMVVVLYLYLVNMLTVSGGLC